MRQRTFSSLGFEIHGKRTRRQRFLAEMDAIVPWHKLCRLIEPHYPRGDRPPTDWHRADAADLLFAGLVQPV